MTLRAPWLVVVAVLAAAWLPGCGPAADGQTPSASGPLELPASIDFGEVEAAARMRKSFTLRSRVASDVSIASWTTSCECLTVEPAALSVPAGGQQTVRLTLDLAHAPKFQGLLRIDVQAQGAFAEEVRFEVLANVRPK